MEEGAVGDNIGGRTLIEPSSVIIEGPTPSATTATTSTAATITERASSLETTASGFLELLAHMVGLYSTVCLLECWRDVMPITIGILGILANREKMGR